MSFLVRPLSPPLWAIGAGYHSSKLVQVSRMVPGAEWRGAYRAVVGYVDAIEVVAEILKGLGLKVDDSALETGPADYTHNLPVSYKRSRDYQRIGIDFLVSKGAGGALLADDMSLGKGHQSLRAARAFKHKTLVVCPAHVRGVWERAPSALLGDEEGGEVYKWWPAAARAGIESLNGVSPRALDPYALVAVTHYDVVHAWAAVLIEWGVKTLILDEGHVLQGDDSRRSKAVREIAAACAVRFALTGTPPTDYPKDFHNLLDILCPGRFGTGFDWGRRYCNGHLVDIKMASGSTKTVWDFKGKSNIDELRRRVMWMSLRRLKSDVAKEMPPKDRQIVDVEVKPAARLKTDGLAVVKSTPAMRKALDFAADSKLPHTVNLVKSHLREGKKVIVGAWRKAVAEQIAGECARECGVAEFIHGGVSQAKRSLRIAKAKQALGASLLVCTIDSCSTGIDFSFADVGTFAELTWEPRELLQFEDRLHRIGRLTPTLIEYVIARGTADELILAGVVRKLGLRDALLGESDDRLLAELRGAEETPDQALAKLADALRGMGWRAA